MSPKDPRHYWPTAFAFAFILGAWQVLSAMLNTPAFPGPVPALTGLYAVAFSGLWEHLLISALRVIISLLLALVTAVPLGLVMGREALLDKLFSQVIYLLYPIPKIVFLPLIMILFGIGDSAKIFIIFLIIFFQILVTTRDSAKGISQQYVYSILSLGARKPDIYRQVIFPACLPEILTAARISLGTAVSVLFFAETVAGTSGLGYLILDAWHRAEYGEMFAGIVSMGILGLILYLVLEFLEKKLCAWKYL